MKIHIKKSHKGLLHKDLGVPQGEKIPASKLKVKSSDSPAVKKRKVFAQNFGHKKGGDGINLGNNPFTGLPDVVSNPLQNIPMRPGYGEGDKNYVEQSSQNSPNYSLGDITGLQKASVAQGATAYPYPGYPARGENTIDKPIPPNKRSINWGHVTVGALAATDMLLPNERTPRKYYRPEDQISYNPNSYGTGSQATMKAGGTLPEFSQYELMEEASKREQDRLPAFAMGASIPGMQGSMYGIVPQTNIQTGERKNIFPYRMANGGDISPEKAQAILKDGKVYNKPLTQKQREFFQNAASVPTAANGLQLYSPDSRVKELSPSTVEFQGASHEQKNDVGSNGIPMSFNGNKAEVEGGEPASINKDGSLTIFGNMVNPITNRLFKNDAKAIADKEKRTQGFIDKGTKLINDNDPNDKFGMLAFNSGRAMMEGGVSKQKQLAEMKEHLSDVQNAMLQIAPTTEKKAKKGITLPKYPLGNPAGSLPSNGQTPIDENGNATQDPWDASNPLWATNPSLVRLKQAIGKHESGNTNIPVNDPTGKSTAYGLYQFQKGTRDQYYNNNKPLFNQVFGLKNVDDFENSFKTNTNLQDAVMNVHLKKLSDDFGGDTKSIALAHAFGERGAKELINQGYTTIKGQKVTWDTPVPGSGNNGNWTPNSYLKGIGLDGTSTTGAPLTTSPTPQVQAYNPNMSPVGNSIGKGISDATTVSPKATDSNYFNFQQPQPINKKSNAEPLSFGQIAPEIYTAATNRVMPVRMQKYSPDLYSPYKVSFQDQINENNENLQGIQKQLSNNPAALSTLAGQTYAANDKVLAEQFRANQGIANDITNKNTALLNEAKSTNLKLGDEQYVRQQEALSKTKSQNYEVLQSISNKIAENKLENRTERVYENLYPSWQFNPITQKRELIDNGNNYIGYNGEPGAGGTDAGDIHTVHNANGKISTTDKELAPIQEQLDQQRFIKNFYNMFKGSDPAKKNGGIIKKNGGIIKAYKSLK